MTRNLMNLPIVLRGFSIQKFNKTPTCFCLYISTGIYSGLSCIISLFIKKETLVLVSFFGSTKQKQIFF